MTKQLLKLTKINNLSKEECVHPLVWGGVYEGKLNVLKNVFNSLDETDSVVQKKTTSGDIGLHFSVLNPSAQVNSLQFLLSCRSNPNAKNDLSLSPLHIACMNGSTECVEELLKNKADPDLVSKRGWSVVHYCCDFGRLSCLKILLAHKAKLTPFLGNTTPLMIVCKKGHSNLIPILLEYGSSVSSRRTFNKSTALHMSASNGHIECCDLLIKNGADINSKDRHNNTPLILATKNNHQSAVKFLLENKALVNIVDKEGNTALHYSNKNQNTEISELLLAFKADPHIQNNKGYSPLHIASKLGNEINILLLLDRGADAYQLDNNKNNSIDLLMKKQYHNILLLVMDSVFINAAYYKNMESFNKLIQRGVDINGTTFREYLETNKTKMGDYSYLKNRYSDPLIAAVAGNNSEAVIILFKKLVNVSNVNYFNGYTVLHQAIVSNNLKMVKLLIEKGSKQTLKEKACQKSPLELAKELQREEISRYLTQCDLIQVTTLAGEKYTRVLYSTKDKIIEYFLTNRNLNIEFLKMFYYMHIYFMSSEDLLSNLINIFNNIDNFLKNVIYIDPDLKNTHKFIQIRIFKLLQIWIKYVWIDFGNNKKLIQLLNDFLKLEETNFKKEIKIINKIIAKQTKIWKQKTRRQNRRKKRSNQSTTFQDISSSDNEIELNINDLEINEDNYNFDEIDEGKKKKNKKKQKNKKKKKNKGKGKNGGKEKRKKKGNGNGEGTGKKKGKKKKNGKVKGNGKNGGKENKNSQGLDNEKNDENGKIGKQNDNKSNGSDLKNKDEPPESIIPTNLMKKFNKLTLTRSQKLKIDLIVDSNELEFARQLTLIKYQYFKRIQIREFRDWIFERKKKKKKKKNIPNIIEYIDHSDSLSSWFIYQIVKESKKGQRAKRVQKMIKIAKCLRKLKNFATMMQIIDALKSDPIKRLKKTWKSVNKVDMNTFNEINNEIEEFAIGNQFINIYRQTNDPCVPYLENFFICLEKIENDQKQVEIKIINNKTLYPIVMYQKQFETINLIMKFQKIPYNFKKVDFFDYELNNFPSFTIERLQELSLVCEKK
ncbi:ankyrin repeat family protein [Anaeramoeba flamelloides]|uniref:Ankyrin repeat family protein n=1 Tax=Anaeramoeba flamelloides TaxID=1746091 RepID=A0AAV8A5Z5_9EUKA|nr:ankyrin repeat family protein [Anaeramoeba flamelloides]